MREDTTVRIKRTTKKRFDDLGKRGETDDALLNRLLDELEGFRKEILKKILTRKSEEK